MYTFLIAARGIKNHLIISEALYLRIFPLWHPPCSISRQEDTRQA